MIGITDSWGISYHVQSYFLYCKNKLVQSGFLEQFFSDVKVISNKEELIQSYELGFSRKLTREGYKIGALVDYRDLYKKFYLENKTNRPEFRNNPSTFFWKEILSDSLNPFIKKNIFWLLEYDHVLFSDDIENALKKQNPGLKFSIILNHLKRFL